jgi:hypothetical protein
MALQNNAIAVEGSALESDPELVVVFDIAGTVDGFRNAVALVDGLEFLSEYVDDELDADDEFYSSTREGRQDRPLHHSLYVVMSNSAAIDDLVRLFRDWQANPTARLAHGLGRFKALFAQMKDIRRWSAIDRTRDTGLLEQWREDLEVVGGSQSSVTAEVEIWFRGTASDRSDAEATARNAVAASAGTVLQSVQIEAIGYHALLIDLPIQAVATVIEQGPESIALLSTDSIMFVSPYAPMSATLGLDEPLETLSHVVAPSNGQLPRVALLDGLPFGRHKLLDGRLIIDDPDQLETRYGVSNMRHGTAMASLILHGDYSDPGAPRGRPLYVRPILAPDPNFPEHERTPAGQLLPDLLHRAFRRLFEGEGAGQPQAPSVRVVNLSIGIETRAFVRQMSPLARLLDWAAVTYNVLVVVSAGNHLGSDLRLSRSSLSSDENARRDALTQVHSLSRLRGILPPGEAMNVLTVGSTHDDAGVDVPESDTTWQLTPAGFPALYGAVGPGFRRSVKPDIFHRGGRALYLRPVNGPEETVSVPLARTEVAGPGVKVAAPGWSGETDRLAYLHGSSNATALVSREADSLFDLLESLTSDTDEFDFPDPQYHPSLVRALLVHASSWRPVGAQIAATLSLPAERRRRELTGKLGYGVLDTERLRTAATSRAVLLGGSSISRNQRHTYSIPKPASVRSRAEHHRITITLAAMIPTLGTSQRYRGARVFFQTPDEEEFGGTRAESDNYMARNGSCQHEIFEGSRALAFDDGDAWTVDIDCRDDAMPTISPVRYGLVVSIEVAPATSELVHDEVREGLRTRLRQRTAAQVRL